MTIERFIKEVKADIKGFDLEEKITANQRWGTIYSTADIKQFMSLVSDIVDERHPTLFKECKKWGIEYDFPKMCREAYSVVIEYDGTYDISSLEDWIYQKIEGFEEAFYIEELAWEEEIKNDTPPGWPPWK